MKESTEELCYGPRVVTYISVGLVGSGVAGIALAITFTLLAYSTWVLALCWALGALLLIVGLLWHLSMVPIDDPAQLKVLDENFLDLLRTVWDGTGKVLDIGTGRGRVAVSIAKEFPEVQVTGVDIWTKMSSVFGLTKEGKGCPRTSGKGRAAWRRGCATQDLQRGRYGHGRALWHLGIRLSQRKKERRGISEAIQALDKTS